MKKDITNKQAVCPMPVLMVATYNDDGTVNVMNAAWGTLVTPDVVALNLTETHKTVQNIKQRGAFTVSLADAAHVAEADYFGMASGKTVADKLSAAGMTATHSVHVDAPIVNEFPVCLECEFVEYQGDDYGIGVIGKIVNVCADEEILTDGKVDIVKAGILVFDPFAHGYYVMGDKVGQAFSDGKKLK